MTKDRPRIARLANSLRRHTAGRETDLTAAAVAGYEAEAAEGRRTAAQAGRPWAEPVDLGVAIDPGAPVPHLVTDGLRAVLVFHAGLEPEPDWDGTSVTVVATFLQSDDPALQLDPVAAQPVVWNPKEWLNAKRGL